MLHLKRRKKVDFGEFLNGSSTLFTSDQSPAFQILTVLSSDLDDLVSLPDPQVAAPATRDTRSVD